MSKGFELEFSFVEKWGRLAKAEYLQVYIYALSNFKKSGKVMSAADISKKLHIEIEAVLEAIDFWVTAEVLKECGDGYCFPKEEDGKPQSTKGLSVAARLRTRPSYDSAEIDAAASVNGNIDYLFKQAEKILEKLLSPSDFEMIYSFVDWLGLPVEVVIMFSGLQRVRARLARGILRR